MGLSNPEAACQLGGSGATEGNVGDREGWGSAQPLFRIIGCNHNQISRQHNKTNKQKPQKASKPKYPTLILQTLDCMLFYSFFPSSQLDFLLKERPAACSGLGVEVITGAHLTSPLHKTASQVACSVEAPVF